MHPETRQNRYSFIHYNHFIQTLNHRKTKPAAFKCIIQQETSEQKMHPSSIIHHSTRNGTKGF